MSKISADRVDRASPTILLEREHFDETLRPTVYAVLGYGSQGRALALNLSDSGCEVIIGLPAKSKSIAVATTDSFRNILTVQRAVERADIIVFALPDHLHARVYKKDIAPHLKTGQTLLFLHGSSVHFGLIEPPNFVDVIMLAPHAPGVTVREKYLRQESVSSFWTIHQDFTKNARRTLFRFAHMVGISATPEKMIETTFEDEAVGDLFGEQVVLCGGLSQLIHQGFETLVTHGISSENAYIEVCYQLDLIVDLIKRHGIQGMYERISVAARYGSYLTGPKIIDADTKKRMRDALKEITSGRFARALSELGDADVKKLNKDLASLTSPAFERAAKKFAE